MSWFAQDGYGVRFDWGHEGARRLAVQAGCLVVVDVLSFTTSVSVAVEKGVAVYPFEWKDERASQFAHDRQARLAGGRRTDGPWTLSPAALRAAPFTPRLVLPSPNGSSISFAAETLVVAGCLRNATAVGRWLSKEGYGGAGRPVVIIAAGERWPDGSLRPALEDALGAGAIISALKREQEAPPEEPGIDSPAERIDGSRGRIGGSGGRIDGSAERINGPGGRIGGPGGRIGGPGGRIGGSGEGIEGSPEAEAVQALFEGTTDVADALARCASGRELIEGGFADDVEVAAELDLCGAVPVLRDGAFA